jgi:arabinofuranosyltransferase
VGGDFMSARFLSAPLFLASAILLRHIQIKPVLTIGLAALVIILGFTNPRPSLTTNSEFGVGQPIFMENGIADERSYFYHSTGVLRWRKNLLWPDSYWSVIGERYKVEHQRVFVAFNAGTMAYHAGPDVFMLDTGALGDALLARLPSVAGEERPGHYFRAVPAGYFETVSTGSNHIEDRGIAEYYDHLHEVISGDLWSWHRIGEIVAINLGKYNHLLPK